MPWGKKKDHPADPSGLAAGSWETQREFEEMANEEEKQEDRHHLRASAGEALPGFKDQARSVEPRPQQPLADSSSATMIPIAEGIPIDDNEVEVVPPQQPVVIPVLPPLQPVITASATGSSTDAAATTAPKPTTPVPAQNPRQGMDLCKHVIWGAVILGSVVTVAVVVGVVVSSGKSSPSPAKSIDSLPPTPTPPNAPAPAPVNLPMPNPSPPPTPKPVVDSPPPPPPPPTDPPRPPPTARPLPPPTPRPRPPPTPRPTDPPMEEPALQVEGWVLGAEEESCNTACTAVGGACNADGNERIDDDTTIKYVAETLFGLTCTDTDSSTNTYAPYFLNSDSECWSQPSNHDCSASTARAGVRLMCCCSNNLADCPVSATPSALGWVLGAEEESCNTACSAAGGGCNAAGNERINDEATVLYVVETLFGLTCTDTGSSTNTYAPYFRNSDSECWYQPSNHNCSASASVRPMCCCSNDLADCPVAAAPTPAAPTPAPPTPAPPTPAPPTPAPPTPAPPTPAPPTPAPPTPAPPTPAAPTPAAPQVEGWVLGRVGESCNDACAAAGGACNAAGNERVNDAATISYVAETLFGLTCSNTPSSTWDEAPYFRISNGECRYQPSNHICSSADDASDIRNMCCCADDLADCPVSA